jgi:hypothetical protein
MRRLHVVHCAQMYGRIFAMIQSFKNRGAFGERALRSPARGHVALREPRKGRGNIPAISHRLRNSRSRVDGLLPPGAPNWLV